MTKPSKAEAIRVLSDLANRVPVLGKGDKNSSAFVKWKRDSILAVKNIFGEKSYHTEEVVQIINHIESFEYQVNFKNALPRAEGLLSSMLDEVDNYWQEEEEITAIKGSSPSSIETQRVTNRVFIVHGHEHAVMETVARFLIRIGLEPVILHEQPNQGRTIIEKFQDYSDVSYAVVLLTPDDTGGLANKPEDFKPRARQNVVFEFGYFIGKLGRKQVCGLVRGDIEVPSDYSGVLYIAFDAAGLWKFELARELKAAGLGIDANRML